MTWLLQQLCKVELQHISSDFSIITTLLNFYFDPKIGTYLGNNI